MPNLLLVDYLQRCRAQHAIVNATPAYTAEETIRLNRISPRRFAKVVMVRLDEELAMVVMPAHYRLAPKLLGESLGVKRVELATERQFRNRFPRCEVGSIPPIGHLFGVRAFLVPAFDEFADIYCKSGSHHELLRMPFREMQRFAHWDSVEKAATLRLRSPTANHLQRLLKLAKVSGIDIPNPLRQPFPLSSS
ncbi:MAG: YbaK/prolyl-tRNA synthetase associated region [Verrucomicrobiaceae bacterium]|nr:YbaK/prolyl-tRNA synthetase associated region [Verrucomicrobiaceae bacterium]